VSFIPLYSLVNIIIITPQHNYRYGEVMKGVYWRNNAESKAALTHLFQYMPKRDAVMLFDGNGDDSFLLYLFEHMRYAFLAKNQGFNRNVSEAPQPQP